MKYPGYEIEHAWRPKKDSDGNYGLLELTTTVTRDGASKSTIHRVGMQEQLHASLDLMELVEDKNCKLIIGY